jgi:hypothetical protein
MLGICLLARRLVWMTAMEFCDPGQTKPEHLQSEFGEDLRVQILLALYEKQSTEALTGAKDATLEKA